MPKELIIYQNKSGEIEFKGDFQKETLWASLQQIADLFEIDKSGISRHIKNIYKTQELQKKSTVAIFATVQKEGNRKVRREIEFFNLDLILSVGYRVNSKKATVFRQWATKTLRQYILDGYAINKKRLLETKERFKELQETISFLQEKSKLKMLTNQQL